MKKIFATAICCLALLSSYAQADSAAAMKNWQDYMTPGDIHKMMAKWEGKWIQEVSMWHAPGTPAEKSKAEAKSKMVMGGRYLVEEHKGTMMGQPFDGLHTLAYDNAKKKFISTWIDNLGTGVMVMEGTWDAASKTANFSGMVVDPAAGDGKEMPVRQVFRVIDDNNHHLEMFLKMPDGTEFKMMEIKATRK